MRWGWIQNALDPRHTPLSSTSSFLHLARLSRKVIMSPGEFYLVRDNMSMSDLKFEEDVVSTPNQKSLLWTTQFPPKSYDCDQKMQLRRALCDLLYNPSGNQSPLIPVHSALGNARKDALDRKNKGKHGIQIACIKADQEFRMAYRKVEVLCERIDFWPEEVLGFSLSFDYVIIHQIPRAAWQSENFFYE